MTFSPDIPSSALGPNEYNKGHNVETDTRGVRPVLGDEYILSQVPGTAIFVSAGYRNYGVYWFIVGTLEGRWFGVTGSGITNITPGYDPVTNPNAYLPGYYANMPITDSWNGTVLFLNDSINAPMYLLADGTQLRLYDAPPDNYIWNYEPTWESLTAGWMRLWATPNVGSILIAGNLTAVTTSATTNNYPTTVRWSQSFGLNSGPTTWAPTLTNVANELEVPVRGPVVDGFPCNGNFYVCSYWDTVVFNPINYTSTSAPIIGVKLLNQGRGLLNENCWANADDVVYGLDARDIWVFNGSSFKSLGNQRVKDWFYGYNEYEGRGQLNPEYSDRTFMINNTSSNQIEIYYADQDSTGWPNKMLSYRYDLDIFNPPRNVDGASHAVESPVWTGTTTSLASRGVVYSSAIAEDQRLVQKDVGNYFTTGDPVDAEFRRDNVTFGIPYTNQVLLHRILPEVTGTGNITITIGGAYSVGQDPTLQDPRVMAIDTDNPWVQMDQNNYRVVTLAATTGNTAADTWELTAINWQLTEVEDSR